jgi:uncharacterized protein with ParB-like and HNH nuclease domain
MIPDDSLLFSYQAPLLSYQDIKTLVKEYREKEGFAEPLTQKLIDDLLKLAEQKKRQRDTLSLKPVEKLLGEHFFVENYQRGYKWTDQQIHDLLEDIHAFRSDSAESFYCLQPVVVKYHDNKEDGGINGKGYCWELIDGQQRITTIYLILKYLGKETFRITYRTRPGSKDFLERIDSLSIGENEEWRNFIARTQKEWDNVDNYHFFQAWKTIARWFSEKDREEWVDKLLRQTQVIWYDALEKKPIDLFIRLNSGKIPLTNAELIKSLLLHNSIQEDKNGGDKRRTQLKWAQEWDDMELALRRDAFWYFINPDAGKDERPNRLEFLFDIIAKKQDNKGDDYFTFRYFNDRRDEIKTEWDKVKGYFAQLSGWFEDGEDHEKYHLIGFIIIQRLKKVAELLERAEEKGKEEFERELKEIIRKKVPPKNEVDELQYPGDNNQLTKLLLLFNIASIIESKSNYRFPFDTYVKQDWSLEHIHAQKSRTFEDKKAAQAWYDETRIMLQENGFQNKEDFMKEELLKDLEKWNKGPKNTEDSKKLMESIQERLFKWSGGSVDEIHTIDNLALLDKATNSSLNNHIFPEKRRRIIEKDKEGHFIPIATKNVFLKYYSNDISQMNLWGHSDREAYKNAIQNTLQKYFGEGK